MIKKIQHFGIYGIILSNRQLLLVKKIRGLYTGLLDLPGGTPEFLESFEETLHREILEESSLCILRYRQASTVWNIGKYGNTILRHVGVLYFVETEGNIKSNSDGKDSGGCVWCDLEDIEKINCTPFVKKVPNLISDCRR
jgi:ADP-ribose pyrophosphatase YjhB (NUDIX family)